MQYLEKSFVRNCSIFPNFFIVFQINCIFVNISVANVSYTLIVRQLLILTIKKQTILQCSQRTWNLTIKAKKPGKLEF